MTRVRYGLIGMMALALAGAANAMTVLGVYDTGVGVASTALTGGDGVADPHYVIVGGTASDAVVGQHARTFAEFNWFMPDTATARAINASGNTSAEENTTIVFRTTFDLAGYSPGSAVLSGTAQADDSATVELNGHLLTTPPIGYGSATAFTAANPSFFVAGVNDIDFIVHNEGGHTALRVAGLTVSADRVVDAVPEPRTWALLVAGFGLVGAARRRGTPVVAA